LEIAQFIKDHPEITHWVAVDDLNMSVEVLDFSVPSTRVWGVTNFVLTPKSSEGIKQQGVKEKILNFLK
jgi:hypothetical protein